MLLNALNVMGNCRFLRQKKQVKINGEWVDTRSFRYLPLCDESHSIVSIRGGLKNHIYSVGLVGSENAQIETSNTGSGSIEIAPTAIISGVADSDTSIGRPITDAVQIYNCKIKSLQLTNTKKLKIYCSSLLDGEHIPNYGYGGNFGGSHFSEIYLEPSAVSNLTTMQYMFSSCGNLTSLDVSNWNTANVTSMDSMFVGCGNLTSLDVSNWNTSNVTDMTQMFYECSGLTSLDLSNWDISKIRSMYGIFAGCSKLKSINVSNWDTSNCTSMWSMFQDCSSLTSLDVSNFRFSWGNVIDGMFAGCSSLKSLNVSGWGTIPCSSLEGMFYGCSSLVSLDLSSWDTSEVMFMDYMFQGCSSLVSLDLSSWDTSNVKNMDGIFQGCSSLVSLNISGWDMSKVSELYTEYMFKDCSSLETIIMIGCAQKTIDKIKKTLSWDNMLNQVTIIT